MYPLREDETRYTVYGHNAGMPLRGEDLDLKVLEWESGLPSGEWIKVKGVAELKRRPMCQLRIISAPLDNAKGHLELFKQYRFPTGFLSERLQSVTHSFGSRKESDGNLINYCSWFHSLCKNINIEKDKNWQPKIKNPNVKQNAKELSQADFSWLRSGFFLNLQRGPDTKTTVTLICFGAPLEIERRFKNLTLNLARDEVLQDPFILFYIIFDELYLQLDSIAWKLGEVFGNMETKILNRAAEPRSTADRIDFVGLHNVSKHITYLCEGADAALFTLQGLIREVERSKAPLTMRLPTQDSLDHCETLFQSTKLRLVSLEKRMANVINLSFNLVTQEDSSSTKTITFMTFVFLPAGTVAAMFGSQFFNLSVDSNGVPHFVVSPAFWIFWAITLPITAILLALWMWWPRQTKRQWPDTGYSGKWQVAGIKLAKGSESMRPPLQQAV